MKSKYDMGKDSEVTCDEIRFAYSLFVLNTMFYFDTKYIWGICQSPTHPSDATIIMLYFMVLSL